MNHETNPLRPGYRPLVPLEGDELACRTCGVAVPPDEQNGTEQITSYGRRPPKVGIIPEGMRTKEFETVMTRCPACADRRRIAEELNVKFPRARGVLRSKVLADDALERALAVLGALEQDSTTVTTSKAVGTALTHLLDVGTGITWAARFAPHADADADPRTATVAPWSHLSMDDVDRAAEAHDRWLAARVEQVGPVPPPADLAPGSPAACWLCGVGTVDGLKSRARRLWSTARVVPAHLGGRDRDTVTVVVCHTCEAEAEAVGAWGPTVVDRLVFRAAGIARRIGIENYSTDAEAWGTTPREPNGTPWAHVDLEQVRATFEVGGGRRTPTRAQVLESEVG